MFPFVRVERERRVSYASSARAQDGKFVFIVIVPAREPARTGSIIEVPPQTWWMLAIFALLCYLLARYLTSPLRSMQKTIERFGRGDFSARVNSRRADELGQLGRTVDEMAERIDLLLKSQRRLLQDISHELRSPLARLGVAVELARGGGDDSGPGAFLAAVPGSAGGNAGAAGGNAGAAPAGGITVTNTRATIAAVAATLVGVGVAVATGAFSSASSCATAGCNANPPALSTIQP
jgi:signal transduction histidine kinase